jgi:hypothetical protein
MKQLLIIISFITHFLFLDLDSYGQATRENAPRIQLAIIKEVLQTSNYTYLHVKVDTSLQWLAVPSMKADVGDTCYYTGGLLMPDFTSRELRKTFASIIFLEGVGKTPEVTQKAQMIVPEHGTKTKPGKLDINVVPEPGGTTIEELFMNKESYNGKVVKIRGQVVKFKPDIMGKNWAHLQDGTAFGEKYDLTVTLRDTVTIGKVVTFESKVTLNKDFGSGYFFEVILEDAIVK